MEIKTHILCSATFFSPKIVNVEKYGTVEHATDENMAHVHCKLDT
jgi:hypothetical protein